MVVRVNVCCTCFMAALEHDHVCHAPTRPAGRNNKGQVRDAFDVTLGQYPSNTLHLGYVSNLRVNIIS